MNQPTPYFERERGCDSGNLIGGASKKHRSFTSQSLSRNK